MNPKNGRRKAKATSATVADFHSASSLPSFLRFCCYVKHYRTAKSDKKSRHSSSASVRRQSTFAFVLSRFIAQAPTERNYRREIAVYVRAYFFSKTALKLNFLAKSTFFYFKVLNYYFLHPWSVKLCIIWCPIIGFTWIFGKKSRSIWSGCSWLVRPTILW